MKLPCTQLYVEEILDAILPEDLLKEAPRGYAGCGHIAHINLNPEYLPYKHVIGQLIIDASVFRFAEERYTDLDAENTRYQNGSQQNREYRKSVQSVPYGVACWRTKL